ncbi:hypothetical protein B0H13DRAFT_1851119 [Mycena leptocephala]|nr:hypothetical protein B0H13DRAFT_1851119 [Mycena leptocephala]
MNDWVSRQGHFSEAGGEIGLSGGEIGPTVNDWFSRQGHLSEACSELMNGALGHFSEAASSSRGILSVASNRFTEIDLGPSDGWIKRRFGGILSVASNCFAKTDSRQYLYKKSRRLARQKWRLWEWVMSSAADACGQRYLYIPSSDVESTQTLEEAPAEPFATIEISVSTSQTTTTSKVWRPRKEVDETNIVATVRSRAPTSRKREAEEQISEGRHKKSSMRKFSYWNTDYLWATPISNADDGET